MQEYVKRYFWVVVALTIALSALFAAKLVNHVAEAKLLAEAKRGPKVTPPAPSPSAPMASRTKDGKPMVDRNMFCSSCLPPIAVTSTASGPVDPNVIPLTGLPLMLVATHVTDDRHANDAFATILNTATQKQGAYWIGQDIPGAGPVLAIH
jgi:hypothetical protein